jgi:hypothetical protein
MNAPAFKEWAVVVRALLAGEQILDVRKGGIREEGRHFDLQATRFWLYPTSEHQQPELLKPAYRRWVDDSAADVPPDRAIRVSGWADVTRVARVTEPEQLERLASRLIWSCEYAASRLHWKRHDPLWILALRAHQLTDPIVVPWRDDYRGCTSWVPLVDLPADPASLPSTPALTDATFASRLELVERELPDAFGEPERSASS